MKIGTKSVLYGYHCVALHWMFVARGWFHLYGLRRVRIGTRTIPIAMSTVPALSGDSNLRLAYFTSLWDPRLWIAFMIHDLGYWGKPNMDGPEGEAHPEWAARVMDRLFGHPWGALCKYHSRFYAKIDNAAPSALCFADKLAFCYYPEALLLWLVRATGEYDEYQVTHAHDNPGMPPYATPSEWARNVRVYVITWVAKHLNGAWDTDTVRRIHT